MGEKEDEPIDQHAFLYRSRVWPLGGDCGRETRGCIDGTRESMLENELRLWRTKERSMQHDWRLQPLMDAAAQSTTVKMEMEFAQPCKKHPFAAAWYWKNHCRKCAKVYQATPANLHRLRDKLHTPLLALDRDVDVLRRSASLVLEPKIAKAEKPRPWTPGPGAPPETPREEGKPQRWVPQNVNYFGTDFTGLLTPSMLAPEMQGHWIAPASSASAASGASQRSRRSQVSRSQPSRAASLPSQASRSAASRRSAASQLSAAQSDRVSVAAREALSVEEEKRDAPRFSRFAHAPGKPKTPPPIGGPTPAGWAPVPAVGNPEKAQF